MKQGTGMARYCIIQQSGERWLTRLISGPCVCKIDTSVGEMSFLNGYGKVYSQLFMNTIVKNEVDNK
jgi:hypothetical protein